MKNSLILPPIFGLYYIWRGEGSGGLAAWGPFSSPGGPPFPATYLREADFLHIFQPNQFTTTDQMQR